VPLAAGHHWFPALNAPVSEVIAYFSAQSFRVLLCAFLQTGAAIPFGIFVASAVSRLRFLGLTAAGVNIAFFGGMMAAMNEFWSGAVIAVMAQPLVAREAPLVHGLHYLSVALGGPGFTMPFGLLMAGVAGFMKLLPKWVVTLGLLLAAVGELSWLSILLPNQFPDSSRPMAGFLVAGRGWIQTSQLCRTPCCAIFLGGIIHATDVTRRSA
jgi:hypothetical protein